MIKPEPGSSKPSASRKGREGRKGAGKLPSGKQVTNRCAKLRWRQCAGALPRCALGVLCVGRSTLNCMDSDKTPGPFSLAPSLARWARGPVRPRVCIAMVPRCFRWHGLGVKAGSQAGIPEGWGNLAGGEERQRRYPRNRHPPGSDPSGVAEIRAGADFSCTPSGVPGRLGPVHRGCRSRSTPG